MTSISWGKLTGWSGIAFVVTFSASEALLADTPALKDSAADVRQWFEANSSRIGWTTWGVALSVGLLFLLFASGLRSILGSAGVDGADVWSRLSFASAITLVAIAGAKSALWPVAANENVLAAASDGTIKALTTIELIMLGTAVPWTMAVFLLGASIVVFQSGVLARWLGWFGLSVVFVFAVGSLWLPTGGDEQSFLGLLTFVGYIGFLIWTVGAATSMIRLNSLSTS